MINWLGKNLYRQQRGEKKKKIYIWGKRDMQESVWNSVTFKSPDNSCHVTGINLYRWESTRMKVCASKEKKKNVWNRYLEAVCATLCFYFFIVKTADFIMCPNNNVLSPPNYWRFFCIQNDWQSVKF